MGAHSASLVANPSTDCRVQRGESFEQLVDRGTFIELDRERPAVFGEHREHRRETNRDPHRSRPSGRVGLDADHRREVASDAAPGVALVGGHEDLAGAGPEPEPGRVESVGRERVAEHREVRVLLG